MWKKKAQNDINLEENKISKNEKEDVLTENEYLKQELIKRFLITEFIKMKLEDSWNAMTAHQQCIMKKKKMISI